MDSTSRSSSRINIMKLFILFVLPTLPSDNTPHQITRKEDCVCWEDFKPEKNFDGSYYCRGEKHHRIFPCNDEKPPICKCLVDGKIIEMDLGELNCISVNPMHGRWCHNREEMAEYFKKHPDKMSYD